MTRSDNLVLETRKEGSPTARAALRQKLSLDENGDVAVGQHLYGLTAEHDGRHPRRPCEAIAIRSQPFLFAASMMAR
jgi:hypothetical protein